MGKSKIFCPIIRCACVECPIYRGRHYYICEQRQNGREEDRGISLDFGELEDLFEAKKLIKNVEELIERSEL
ncbi:MAG: hypothetical protein NZ583_00585 [Desulfobacterota bacterium]|nr:hypothetical protein [Thermodesulfobacteriota bacterium]MDW8001210.1 hypothetical protein [Deltaproteobacteria bacterium]